MCSSKLVRATIQAAWAETPSVRGLRLVLDEPHSLSFQPGQWVDLHAPHVTAVGGYSICSTPAQLAQSGALELCVKASRHPCAQWVHTQAAPGAQVCLQTGGSFVLADAAARASLFVAGGIGITCLAAMLGHLVEQRQAAMAHTGSARQRDAAEQAAAQLPPPPRLLYSAASPQEFALLPRLLQWQQEARCLDLQLHTTRQHAPLPAQLQAHVVRRHRIGAKDLQAAVAALQAGGSSPGPVAYVCGPPGMTDDVVQQLVESGVAPGDIKTERWW